MYRLATPYLRTAVVRPLASLSNGLCLVLGVICLTQTVGTTHVLADGVDAHGEARPHCHTLIVTLPAAPPCALLKGLGLHTPRDALVRVLNTGVGPRLWPAGMRIVFR